jgi:cytochrome b561
MTSVPEAVPQDPVRRYSNGAVAFHWITAALVLTQVVIGFAFAEFMDKGPARSEMFTWHKTLGATILLLTIARLVYRLKNPPPPFPPELPRWERLAAVWNHRAFYVLLIALPLTGLIAVSGHADTWFTPLVGGAPLPVVPGVSPETGDMSGDVHVILVYSTIALLLLHVAAALKQQFFDRTRQTSGRMPPFQPKSGENPVAQQS